MSRLHWYVVRTQPQCESRVQRGAREQGLEAYLPTETRWRHSRRTKSRVHRALFTSYLFVGLRPAQPEFHLVRALDGFLGFLGIDGRPLQVQFYRTDDEPDAFSIQALRDAETLGLFDFTRSKKITFTPGQPVRIVGGNFSGFMAEVLEEPADDAKRVRILMQAIVKGGRAWPTTLSLDQIEAA